MAGSRTIESYDSVARAIEASGFDVTELVSGMCPSGVDYHGLSWADKNGVKIKKFYADWGKHGRAAGPLRNAEMAAYADALVAVWDGESRGTKSMLELMKAKGKPIKLYKVRKMVS